MAIIDRVKYDGPANVLVWKWPSDQLSWGTQLIINETQEVLFLKGGKICDILGPGTHTLQTANIPILRSLINIPFGGDTPFAAEVYYVNKAVHMDVKFGTSSPVSVMDPQFKVPLPVRANGQFGIQVKDARALFIKLSATTQQFTLDTLEGLFRAALMTRLKDYISETVKKNNMMLLDMGGAMEEISEAMKAKMEKDFAEYGVGVVNFFFNTIECPEEDETVKRLKKALADKMEMQVMGADDYKTRRTFDTMEKAAGTEGGTVGMGMGVGMGAGMGQMMAGMMGQVAQPGQPAAAPRPAAAVTACPSCQAQNPAGAKFCSGCGKPMAPAACPKCQTQQAPGAKFCSSCGEKIG